MEEKLIRDAELLRDWTLDRFHPDKYTVGIHPWRLIDDDSAYRKRDEAIIRVTEYILANKHAQR